MENIKIGVFGTFRGLQYIEAINILDGAEVTAICDRDPAAFLAWSHLICS